MKIAKCAEGSLNQRVSKLKENELQVRVQGPEEELAMCDHIFNDGPCIIMDESVLLKNKNTEYIKRKFYQIDFESEEE